MSLTIQAIAARAGAPASHVDERAHPIGPQAGAATGGAAICGTVDCLVQAAGGRGEGGGQGVSQDDDGQATYS
jgi:hypothetical protein